MIDTTDIWARNRSGYIKYIGSEIAHQSNVKGAERTESIALRDWVMLIMTRSRQLGSSTSQPRAFHSFSDSCSDSDPSSFLTASKALTGTLGFFLDS